MRIVIDIPEGLYEVYKGRPPMLGDEGMDMIAQAIANGTPLPKGHGRLIDADAYIKDMLNSREFDFFKILAFFKILDMQPTIIEADVPDMNVGNMKEGEAE